jgi:hypothetical protein
MVGVKLFCRYRSFTFCLFVLACAALHFTARVESFALTVPPFTVVRKKELQQQRVSDACPESTTTERRHLHARASSQSMRLYASSPSTPDNNDDDSEKNKKDTDDASASPSPNASSSSNNNNHHDYSTEEILLCLHLEVLSDSGVSVADALAQVQAYTQSFPFAAVLPVQPLSYLPTATGGVNIKFLRKKTDEKSGIEGGLCFFIEGGDTMENDHNEAAPDAADDSDKSSRMIVLTVKRNSAGQTIRKIIAERLVITSYVASLTANAGDSDSDAAATPATPLAPGAAVITGSRPSPVAEQVVRVTSLFHKWM